MLNFKNIQEIKLKEYKDRVEKKYNQIKALQKEVEK